MNRPIRHRAACIAVAVTSLLAGSIALAADVTGGADGISLSRVSSDAQTVRISGPNGYTSVSSGAGLQSLNGARLADGLYKYEITETQCVNVSYAEIAAATRDNAANGRAADAQPSSCREVLVDSGAFRIVDGAVPNSALVEE